MYFHTKSTYSLRQISNKIIDPVFRFILGWFFFYWAEFFAISRISLPTDSSTAVVDKQILTTNEIAADDKAEFRDDGTEHVRFLENLPEHVEDQRNGLQIMHLI